MGIRCWILFPSALFFPLIMSFTLPILFIGKKILIQLFPQSVSLDARHQGGVRQENIPEREKIVLKGHP
jgi:hypothetical protein